MDDGIMMTRLSKHRMLGFSLPELMLAIFVVGIGVTAVAPLFVHATRRAAASADLADVGAQAVRRMEILRLQDFSTQTAGGSLTTNTAGFVDTADPEVVVRWEIVDESARMKLITVRALANRAVEGRQKEITLALRRTK